MSISGVKLGGSALSSAGIGRGGGQCWTLGADVHALSATSDTSITISFSALEGVELILYFLFSVFGIGNLGVTLGICRCYRVSARLSNLTYGSIPPLRLNVPGRTEAAQSGNEDKDSARAHSAAIAVA